MLFDHKPGRILKRLWHSEGDREGEAQVICADVEPAALVRESVFKQVANWGYL